MNYSDWGPFLVNPKPTEPGVPCYQCGAPDARVQHIIQGDMAQDETGAWRVREDAPKRFKCHVVRDCAKAAS